MPVWPSLTAAGADVAGARRLLLLAPLVTCCYRIHLPHQRNRCGASPGFQIEMQHSSIISSVGPLTAHLARFGRTCACEPCEALRIERRTNMTSFETGHFALETHGEQIASAIRDFLERNLQERERVA
jgi:hypothetical protein